MTNDEVMRAVREAKTLDAAVRILVGAGCPRDRAPIIAMQERGERGGFDLVMDDEPVKD